MKIDKKKIRLKTERLLLRPMTRNDVPAMFKVIKNNHELTKYMLWEPPKKMEEAYELFDNFSPDNIDLIALRDDKFTGKMVIRDIQKKRHKADISSADLGFWIAPEFHNQGLMTEALLEICRFCFEDLKLRRLTCGALTQNIASQRVQEKVGFRKVGVEKKKFFMNKEYYDEYYYELLAENFLKKKKVKNYAFIDGNNVILGLLAIGWKLDYKKFHRYLKDKYRVEKTFWFIGHIKENEGLYRDIKKAGFEVIFKKTVIDRNGKVKGNIDVLLTVKCYETESEFDGIVLVSGDGDFVDIIKDMQQKNKSIRIIVPNEKRRSKLLSAFEEECRYLSEWNLRKKLEYKKNG